MNDYKMLSNESPPQKSLFITYLLWLCFGWFGAHHFYLGRDKQAFVWWSTLGGYVYLGWIRDFWRIPEYVDEANKEKAYIKKLAEKIMLRNQPPFNPSRFIGEILIGQWYGYLVYIAIPDEAPSFTFAPIACIGVAVGVYMIGNIGVEEGPFFAPYLSSLASIAFSTIADQELNYFYCSVTTALVFNYYRKYKTRQQKTVKMSKRISRLSGGAAIVFLLWTSFFNFNATITYQNGEKIKLKDSLNHFFKSPVWTDFKFTMWEIYGNSDGKQWDRVFDEFVGSLDPTGELNALKVLGLDKNSTDEEIRKSYKKLALKWHPDRHKEEEKEEAEKKFIAIQQAYEILNKRKKSSKQRRADSRNEF